MNQKNDLNDVFEIKNQQPNQPQTNPLTVGDNVFNQKIKKFYIPPPTEKKPTNSVPKMMTPLPQPAVKKSKKWLWLILILIIVIFIGGGAAAAYYFIIRISPDQLADLMVDKMLKVKSFAYNGELDLSGQQNVKLKFTGQTDNHDSANSLNNVLFNADIASVFGSLNPELEFRWLNKESFVRLNLGNLTAANLINDQYNNQWLKIDVSFAKNNPYLPPNQKVLPENITAEQMLNLKNLVSELSLFDQIKELNKENINNISTRHLSFILSKSALEKFIIDFNENILKTQLSATEENNLKNDITSWPTIAGEMWIGANDYYLYKLSLPLEIKTDDLVTQVNFIVNLSDFEKAMAITAPASYKTLSEIQNNQATSTALGPDLDSDGDGLKDNQEELYKTNKLNPDTDGDDYQDGEEVQHGYNPLGSGKL